MTTYRNHSIAPELDTVRCTVCGWPVDEARTQEPETSPIVRSLTTDRRNPLSDQVLGDFLYEVTIPAYSACPFCGSPRWRTGGRRGDL